jgi:hypothetical protein
VRLSPKGLGVIVKNNRQRFINDHIQDFVFLVNNNCNVWFSDCLLDTLGCSRGRPNIMNHRKRYLQPQSWTYRVVERFNSRTGLRILLFASSITIIPLPVSYPDPVKVRNLILSSMWRILLEASSAKQIADWIYCNSLRSDKVISSSVLHWYSTPSSFGQNPARMWSRYVRSQSSCPAFADCRDCQPSV